MISEKTVQNVLAAAVSTGAGFAEIFVENNCKSNIAVTNGIVDKANSGMDKGCGIRIINGERVIYVYTNNMSEDNLIRIAKEGAAAIKGDTEHNITVFNRLGISNAHPVAVMPDTVEKKRIVDFLMQGHSRAMAYDSLITQTGLSYLDSVQNVLIANTEGLWAEDERVRTRISVSVVASNESEKQTGYFGPGALQGFEFCEDLDIEAIADEAARCAVTMLKAENCPSGKMPVVMGNGFGGVIFHEACGHGLEAAAISKRASVFTDKIGEKIASDKVTAIDDGTMPNQWGSMNIDDEGTPCRKNVLIEKGVLKTYMTDRYNGGIIGMAPSGNSRRESYKLVPVSRMTNTYIAAGTDKREDIIADTEYGLYAKYMGGGSVNPASGDFNFAVNEAYIIRNGKICEPVRGATLIGKGSVVLKNIDRVSDDLALAEGMCGASSGSIPVCVGQPMLRVQNITVGGRG